MAKAESSSRPSRRGARTDTITAFLPGETVWTLALNTGLAAPPAYDGARAYFALQGNSLVAYDLSRGERLWIVPVDTRTEPAAGEDFVFVVEPREIVALRGADGSRVWAMPLADTLAVPLVWDTGWLVAASASGTIFTYRASDGELLWQRNLGSPTHARPALAGDRVYVPTEDGRVVALRLQSGAPLWEHRLGAAPGDILALEDRLFVGSKDNFFYCLKTDTGEQDWRWRTGADIIGEPAIDEHNVYFVSLDNVLRALNRGHGVQQWMQPLSFRPTSGPVRIDTSLVIAGLAATIQATNVKDGKPAGERPTYGELAAPPHALVSGDTTLLLVITRDIVKGATVTAVKHSIEPAILSPIAPLPNITPVPATWRRPTTSP